MKAFLNSPVGTTAQINGPHGPLVLTNQGGFVYTAAYNGGDAICNLKDLK